MTIPPSEPNQQPVLLLQLQRRVEQYQRRLQQSEYEVGQLRLLHKQLKQSHQTTWLKLQKVMAMAHKKTIDGVDSQ